MLSRGRWNATSASTNQARRGLRRAHRLHPMHPVDLPPLVDLRTQGWPDDRREAALAVVVPNSRRIAQAALQRLTLDDHIAVHPAWCEAQAASHE